MNDDFYKIDEAQQVKGENDSVLNVPNSFFDTSKSVESFHHFEGEIQPSPSLFPKKNILDSFFQFIKKKESDILVNVFNSDENPDLKTDLKIEEILIFNRMKIIDLHLKECGLDSLYEDFSKSHFRLKVSKDRKSREEFVNLLKKDRTDDQLNTLAKFNNLLTPRQ